MPEICKDGIINSVASESTYWLNVFDYSLDYCTVNLKILIVTMALPP